MGKEVKLGDLITEPYRLANRSMHESKERFGGSGWKHGDKILDFARELKPVHTILDYGCGEGTLKKKFVKKKTKFIVREYDPAIPKKSRMPLPADLVVCTDVMEHVEPEKVDNVLAHVHSLTRKGCYMVIACRPAQRLMPDGSNAHRTIEDTPFWFERVSRHAWLINRVDEIRRKSGDPHSVTFYLVKDNAR